MWLDYRVILALKVNKEKEVSRVYKGKQEREDYRGRKVKRVVEERMVILALKVNKEKEDWKVKREKEEFKV